MWVVNLFLLGPIGSYPAFFQILHYSYDTRLEVVDSRFQNLVVWNGTKKVRDLQDVSIFILNVTYDHAGEYLCFVNRTLMFPNDYIHNIKVNKTIILRVVDKGK